MKKYYGIIYEKNGKTSMTEGFDTPEEAIELMKLAIAKHFDEVAATTYIVRENPPKRLFGNPKSRDLMQDKKFLRSLEA